MSLRAIETPVRFKEPLFSPSAMAHTFPRVSGDRFVRLKTPTAVSPVITPDSRAAQMSNIMVVSQSSAGVGEKALDILPRI